MCGGREQIENKSKTKPRSVLGDPISLLKLGQIGAMHSSKSAKSPYDINRSIAQKQHNLSTLLVPPYNNRPNIAVVLLLCVTNYICRTACSELHRLMKVELLSTSRCPNMVHWTDKVPKPLWPRNGHGYQ